MMRVSYAEHGGLAAGLRRPQRTLDSTALSPASAAELKRLVEAAKAARPVARSEKTRARDAMSYEITIEEAGRSTVLRQSDTDITEAFAQLLSWLKQHAP